MTKVRAPTATIVPIRGSSKTARRGLRKRRIGPRCSPRTQASPRRPSSTDRSRRAVGLNQSGAHSYVSHGGCKRRQRDCYRRGAVVGRLEESCENGDRGEAGALYPICPMNFQRTPVRTERST